MARIPPHPDYVVICSPDDEWKRNAEMVVSRGLSLLLIGANGADPFLEELKRKHGLVSRNEKRERIMFWKAVSDSDVAKVRKH
jgi:hypothetical protein